MHTVSEVVRKGGAENEKPMHLVSPRPNLEVQYEDQICTTCRGKKATLIKLKIIVSGKIILGAPISCSAASRTAAPKHWQHWGHLEALEALDSLPFGVLAALPGGSNIWQWQIYSAFKNHYWDAQGYLAGHRWPMSCMLSPKWDFVNIF